MSQTPALCIKWHYNWKIINDPILIAKAIASQASPFGLRSARANTVDIRHFTTTHHVSTTKNDYIIWFRSCGLSIRIRSWWRILGDVRKAVLVPPECVLQFMTSSMLESILHTGQSGLSLARHVCTHLRTHGMHIRWRHPYQSKCRLDSLRSTTQTIHVMVPIRVELGAKTATAWGR